MTFEKYTDDLQQELMSAVDLTQFIEDNEDKFTREKIADVLGELFQKKDLSKATLAKLSGLSEVYLHQVFAGRRTPSRNRVLCLCIGMSATFEETQNVLKKCEHAQLYPKKKRDAIVIYGLMNGMVLEEINEKLSGEDEAPLC